MGIPKVKEEVDEFIKTLDDLLRNSDQMKKLGYKLELQGTRFPLPTTLNELGKDWSFNLGDTSDRESGAYNGQRYWRVGNMYTAEWYKAWTDKKFCETAVELCYKDRPVLLGILADFNENGKYERDTKIIGITDETQYQEEKDLWEVLVNGISLGDTADRSLEEKIGKGEWIDTEYYKKFEVIKDGMSIGFVSSKEERKIYSITIRLNIEKNKMPNSPPVK